jgi:hypothetical protein
MSIAKRFGIHSSNSLIHIPVLAWIASSGLGLKTCTPFPDNENLLEQAVPALNKMVLKGFLSILSKLNWSFYRHPYLDRFKPEFLRTWWDYGKLSSGRGFGYNFFTTGWTRPDGREKELSRSHFPWQHYSNARYNRELTKFMFSFTSDTSTTRNVNNLMFLTGPEAAGKSWYLQYNLNKMREAKLVTLT